MKNFTANRLVHNLKHLFGFGLLTFSLNVSSVDVKQFNKEAYLDLSKPYTYNWNNTQSYKKEDNQATTLLKEVGSTARSALGSTDLDNTNELGGKITDNITNQFINKVKGLVTKTEKLINDKANEYANSFGDGKTEISIRQMTSENPTYSIRTIQPLTDLTDNSTDLTFVQGQINSGENQDDRRTTLNLGIGYRKLLNQGRSIAGINLFTDYESKSQHKRASLGLEYLTSNFSANINRYFPLSDKKVIGENTEEPLAGHDIKLIGQFPYLPWAKIKATQYYWSKTNHVDSKDIKGTILGIEVNLSDAIRLEVGSEKSDTTDRASYARLRMQLPLKSTKLTNFAIHKKPFAGSEIINLNELSFVQRSNKIRVEKIVNGLITFGVFNAATTRATCKLYERSTGDLIASGETGANGIATVSGIVAPAGLFYSECRGGTYTDEASRATVTNAPILHAAIEHTGNGPLTLIASPLSEIAYQLAGSATFTTATFTAATETVATAFGIGGTDIIGTIPTDISDKAVGGTGGAAGNNDQGKLAVALAVVSQMAEHSATDGGQTPSMTESETLIAALVADIRTDNDIDGINGIGVDQALNNFKTGAGANNDGTRNNNVGEATVATNTPNVIFSGGTSLAVRADSTATYSVELNTQPTSNVDVIITPTSDNGAIATVSGAITFSTGNWNTAQLITVTGAADNDDDTNDMTTNITHTVTTSYVSTVATVGVTVTDTSVRGVTNSETTVTLVEESNTTYTLKLDTRPTGNVTITPSSDDTAAATVSGAITFTTTNYATVQTITVNGVQDDDTTNETVTITHSITGADYNTDVSVANVTAKVTDNSIRGVSHSVTSVSLPLNEGSIATYTTKLDTQPTGNVTITPSSSDIAATVSGAVIFSTSNWSTPQIITVTGVEDDNSINENITLTHSITGADYGDNNVTAANVTVKVVDNDTPNIAVGNLSSTLSGNTSEDGTIATFTLNLNTEPTHPVTIALSSGDTTEGTLSPASVTFSTTNWDTAQIITITGINDHVADGSITYTITGTPASDDTDYSGLSPKNISVTNLDDDTRGVINSATNSEVTLGEANSATYTLVLTSEPTGGNVAITASSDDTAAATVPTTALIFTSSNWSTPQSIIVSGVEDDDPDKESVTITHSITGADYGTNSVSVANITANVTDNDTIGVSNSETEVTLGEATSATYTLKLNTQPTGNVTITPSSSDDVAATVSDPITFSTDNWSTAQTIIVNGVQDDDATNESVRISHSITGAEGYDGINISNVNITATINDDDTRGVTNSPTSVFLTEGSTATYTTKLDTQPTGDVTITPGSPDTNAVTVSDAVIFSNSNWNTPQTITVTGVEDDDNINETITLTHSIAGADYGINININIDSVTVDEVTVNVTDDDRPGFAVSAVSGNTSEDSTIATFTLNLNTEPADPVTIALSSGDTTEGTLSPASVTFSTTNWNTAQIITITGVNDHVADGSITYTITGTPASDDPNYRNLSAINISVTNLDDDTVGIRVNPTSVTTSEDGTTASFTIALNSQPINDVVIGLIGDDTEGTLSMNSVTFTNGNWNTVQAIIVTGKEDSASDGAITYNIVATATATSTSTDSNYDGFNTTVSVTNTDNDVAGIFVSNLSGGFSGNTSEDGTTATFTLNLNTQPTDPVTIALSSRNTTEGTLSTASVTFSTTNWNTPQIITITGINDHVADGSITYTIDIASLTSDDPDYSGPSDRDISVTNLDDDTAGVVTGDFSGDSITTTEATTTTFTLVLSSEPTATVSITLSSSNISKATLNPSSIDFTADNWNATRTITITSVNDNVDDGTTTYTITVTPASADTNYQNSQTLSAINIDDDMAGVTVEPTSLNTGEDESQATFTFVLNSEPTDDVTLTLTGLDATEGTLTNTVTTFTADNWNTEQTITVTGVNDSVIDGNSTYALTTTASSSDANYNITVDDVVTVTNSDNNAASITVTNVLGNTTEAGVTVTFTVKINTQPINPVTIALSSDNINEGTLSTANVTFSNSNWGTAQTITITGIDDRVDDGSITYTITATASATSTDTAYNNISTTISVINIDNDTRGVTNSATTITLMEGTTTDTHTIVLLTQPTEPVTITPSSSDTTIATVSGAITFSISNWETPQIITISGVEDDDISNETATITHSIEGADYAENSVSVDDVDVTVTDDDTARVAVSPTSGITTSEAGGKATFNIRLDTQPTDPVTILLSSDNTNEGALSITSVTFTVTDWNTLQTITVTGVSDNENDGDVTYNIVTSATSNDDAYDGIEVANVELTNNNALTMNVGTIRYATVVIGSQTWTSESMRHNSTTGATLGYNGNTDSSEDRYGRYYNWTAAMEGSTAPGAQGICADGWHIPTRAELITLIPTGFNVGLLRPGAGNGSTGFNIQYAGDISSTKVSAGRGARVTLWSSTVQSNNAEAQRVRLIGDSNFGGSNKANHFTVRCLKDTGTAGAPPVTKTVTSSAPAALTINEGSTTATYTLALNVQPTDDVIITPSSISTAIAVTPLTFTQANFAMAQTVTITGVDNNIDSADVTLTLTHTITGGNYGSTPIDDIAITVRDDDTARIRASSISGNTTETGTTATFTLVLDTQPTADVTIPLSSSNTAEGTITLTEVTFTTADWNTPQTITVTGVNDTNDDGNVTYNINIFTATTLDTNYSNISASTVSVTNLDAVAPMLAGGINYPTVVIGAQTWTSENMRHDSKTGITLSYGNNDSNDADGFGRLYNWTAAMEGSTTLGAQGICGIGWHLPTNTEWATLETSVGTFPGRQLRTGIFNAQMAGELSGASGMFSNRGGQTVLWSSTTDSDPSKAYAPRITSSGSEINKFGLPKRNGYSVRCLKGTSTSPAATKMVTQSTTTFTIAENATAIYTLALNLQPTGDVTITPSSADTTIATVSAALTFTQANFDTLQTVTITGVNNNIDNADANATLTHTIIGGNYNGTTITDITLTVTDNDTAGITPNPASVTTTESGTTATFTLTLNTEPTADVIITLSSNDTSEGTLSPSSITFTISDWNTPQAITISGVDDAIDDGNIPYTITGVITSTDTKYDDILDQSFSVTNNNDTDTAGVSNSVASLSFAEDSSATYTIELNSEPTNAITITPSSDNTAAATVSDALTFTPINWNTAQTVTVNGVLNASSSDNTNTTITHTISGGIDTGTNRDGYGNVTIDPVTITVTDTNTGFSEFTYDGHTYRPVRSSGKVWLDRNLGADRVCTALDDTSCYGDYYQWGKNTNSFTTVTSGSTWTDISSAALSAAWKDTTSETICPDEYRVPTEAELATERESWRPNADVVAIDRDDAFDESVLKWSVAGSIRANKNIDTISDIDDRGVYWSSSFNENHPIALHILETTSYLQGTSQARGATIRCIQDTVSASTVGTVPAGVTNSTSSITLNEGNFDTYTTTLNAHILNSIDNPIIITPSSSNTNIATVSAALTFNKFNWNIPQTVTVSGLVVNATAITISHSISDDYAGGSSAGVSVTVTGGGFVPENITYKSIAYRTVQSTTTPKRVWLNKNLGAAEVCVSSTDSACAGDSYQWGALTSNFIDGVPLNNLRNDWDSDNDEDGEKREALWADHNSEAICPRGFRVPNNTEMVDEIDTWRAVPGDSNSLATASNALASDLKWGRPPEYKNARGNMAGDDNGYYWSGNAGSGTKSTAFIIDSTSYVIPFNRSLALAVRCIQN